MSAKINVKKFLDSLPPAMQVGNEEIASIRATRMVVNRPKGGLEKETLMLLQSRLGWEKAIDAAGSATKLAEMIGVSRACVSSWKWRGVPATQCLDVHEATKVPLHQLRPDIYPSSLGLDVVEV